MTLGPSTRQWQHFLGPALALVLGASGGVGRLTCAETAPGGRLSVGFTAAVAGVEIRGVA